MRKSWNELGVPLHDEVQKGIESLNFATMTPIQAATIPQLLNQKDVVAEAVTGSGKTLAFVIPSMEILKRRRWKKHEIGALVVSPTRELAMQTEQVFNQFLNFVSGITQILLVGGSAVEDDVNNFKTRGGNVVVCTPGRFEDLLLRAGDINLPMCLKSLEILILDEADRLLEYGFRKSLDTILSYLPRQRRTALFSATQTNQVQDLIRTGLRNPVLVSVSLKAKHNTPEELNNYYVICKSNNKLASLMAFLEKEKVKKAMLFLPTCACVDYWSTVFSDVCTLKPVLAIHGKMTHKRKRILEKFKGLSEALLLCTDVLARGIDIPEVDWVFQWDPPSKASAFVHRVGRTARQGHKGSSLILLLENEETYVHFIEKNQRLKLHRLDDTSEDSAPIELRERLRNLQRTDREIMEKATRAFVSHVRAYSKHECSLLLPIQELPFEDVASTYGLLQLPKMPELKNRSFDFDSVGVDLSAIPYKDKKKEEIRREKLRVYEATKSWPGRRMKKNKKSTEPWSLAKQKKIDKKEKRMKHKKMKENGRGDKKAKKRKMGVSEEDLTELAKDIALMKKLKKKKISDEDFDVQFGVA